MTASDGSCASTACLACGGQTATTLDGVFDVKFGVPGTFRISRCCRCGIEQTLPRLSPEELFATYERYYNFRNDDVDGYLRRRSTLIKSGIYRLWVRLDGDISFILKRGAGRRLLDVGCNEGRNLELYRRSGFAAEGVESNPVAASAARQRGLPVHVGEFDDLPTSAGPYDVIVLSNVLEHSLSPVDMVAQARRHLRPGGELWVSCPNAASWARHLFGRSWINWHPPFHLAHFASRNLHTLLVDNGFEVSEAQNRTPALWVAQSLLARRYAVPGRPTTAMRRSGLLAALMVTLRVLLFPALWLGNRLDRGDCLVVRARRQ